jgi:hypothetical protein
MQNSTYRTKKVMPYPFMYLNRTFKGHANALTLKYINIKVPHFERMALL